MKTITGQALGETLLDSFFDSGNDDAKTMAVMDLSKAGAFEAAVESLADLLMKEIGTKGFALGFLKAADQAYRMGRDFVDLSDFLTRLKGNLPPALAHTTLGEISARIDAIAVARQVLFTKFQHTPVVPDATGINVFIPGVDALSGAAAWDRFSKLYYTLPHYKTFHFVLGEIFGSLTGRVTDDFLAADTMSWMGATAEIGFQGGGFSVSRNLTKPSLDFVVGADMRFGFAAGDENWYVGDVDGKISPDGQVTATWNQKTLTLKSGDTHCAAYHDFNGGQLEFMVNYYTPGAVVSRAFGVYSIQSGSWTLFHHNKDGSIAEVTRGANIAWLVPMVRNEGGELVETPLKECTTLYYTTYAL